MRAAANATHIFPIAASEQLQAAVCWCVFVAAQELARQTEGEDLGQLTEIDQMEAQEQKLRVCGGGGGAAASNKGRREIIAFRAVCLLGRPVEL